MRIEAWQDAIIDLKPSDRRIKTILKEVGLVKGFNEGYGIDASIQLPKLDKPYIDFDYDYKNVKVWHQPDLTNMEKSKGCFRPDHVINSVAFYHAKKRDNEYKTGKIGHLYRVLLVDSKGFSCWADWTVEKFGILRLWLDNTFIKIGTPPFKILPVGDTFGYTSVGLSTFLTFTENPVGCYPFMSASHAGQISSISMYTCAHSGTYTLQLAIAADTNPTAARKALTNGINISTTPQWWTDVVTSGGSLLANTNYDLVAFEQSDINAYYDSIAGYSLELADALGTTITWLNREGLDSFKMSIYATYLSTPPKSPLIARLISAGVIR